MIAETIVIMMMVPFRRLLRTNQIQLTGQVTKMIHRVVIAKVMVEIVVQIQTIARNLMEPIEATIAIILHRSTRAKTDLGILIDAIKAMITRRIVETDSGKIATATATITIDRHLVSHRQIEADETQGEAKTKVAVITTIIRIHLQIATGTVAHLRRMATTRA